MMRKRSTGHVVLLVLLRELQLVLDTEHSKLSLCQLGLSSDQVQGGDCTATSTTTPHTPPHHLHLLGLLHHLGLGEGLVDTDDPASDLGVETRFVCAR